MENKIKINGVEIKLTEEQAKAIYGTVDVKNPYNFKDNEDCWSVSSDGNIFKTKFNCDYTRCYSDVGNLFSDKEYAQQMGLKTQLLWLMQKYSIEHGGLAINWEDTKQQKYYCYYHHAEKRFKVGSYAVSRDVNNIYFIDIQTAENCIAEVIKPFIKEYPEFEL